MIQKIFVSILIYFIYVNISPPGRHINTSASDVLVSTPSAALIGTDYTGKLFSVFYGVGSIANIEIMDFLAIKHADPISKVSINKYPLSPLVPDGNQMLFHAFLVFQTTDFQGNPLWWSLEKNTKCVVMQVSPRIEDVRDYLNMNDSQGRKKRPTFATEIESDGPFKFSDLFTILMRNFGEEYNVFNDNCQKFASVIFEGITGQKWDPLVTRLFPSKSPHETIVDFEQHISVLEKKRENKEQLVMKEDWEKLEKLWDQVGPKNDKDGSRRRDIIDKQIRMGDADFLAKLFEIQDFKDIFFYGCDYSPLHLAVKYDSPEMVDVLVKAGASLDRTHFTEGSVLIHTIKMGSLKMARHLIEKYGCDPTINMTRINVFHFSAGCVVDPDVMDYLLDQVKMDINDRDNKGSTHCAFKEEHVEIIRRILLHPSCKPSSRREQKWPFQQNYVATTINNGQFDADDQSEGTCTVDSATMT